MHHLIVVGSLKFLAVGNVVKVMRGDVAATDLAEEMGGYGEAALQPILDLLTALHRTEPRTAAILAQQIGKVAFLALHKFESRAGKYTASKQGQQ
jgi:hypothetical protein